MSSSSWLHSSGLNLSEQEVQLIVEVEKAGGLLLSYWEDSRTAGRNLQIKQKPDGSFVTEADFASNDLLIGALARLFPETEYISEELAKKQQGPLSDFWIVDPLDGTQSFINGDDDFAVLVARCTNSRASTGIMHFPVRAQTLIAKSGFGACCNGTALQVSRSTALRPAALYLRNIEFAANHPLRPSLYPKWMDSGMAFHKLCRGELDGVLLRIVNHQEWDLAAPAALISESGGCVSDENGQALSFTGTGIGARYFIASNGILHQQLLEMLAQHMGTSCGA
jgi:myo-inositol-1(or 4)-monophosphatase